MGRFLFTNYERNKTVIVFMKKRRAMSSLFPKTLSKLSCSEHRVDICYRARRLEECQGEMTQKPRSHIFQGAQGHNRFRCLPLKVGNQRERMIWSNLSPRESC